VQLALAGQELVLRLRVAIEMDPAVGKAMESMPKAKSLLENAKKQIVQRNGGRAQRAAR